MKAKSNILIISDMCGYGKVSAAVQMPILSYMGHDVFNLPTMLISNTFPYGKYAVMESTSYMKDAMQKWDELGIHFDAITTGFLASEEQAKMVAHYCREQAEQGTEIFVDPVMTEAEAYVLVDKLRAFGSQSVLITTCIVDQQHAVVGYNHFNNEHFLLPYEEIPVQFPGTGDIFSSIIVGRLRDGDSLRHATRTAMDILRNWIGINKDNEDKNRGIPVERHLSDL